MKNTNQSPAKPNKFLMAIGYCLLWPYLKLRYKIHVIGKEEFKKIKPPYIIISNHGAAIDPLFLAGAVYPRLINFVGGYAYFQNKKLKWFLNEIGAIPKFQYQTDLVAMRKMTQVTKEGILGLFPAGRMPSCGTGFPIPDSLAKLIKICKVPIVEARINGSYMSKPKWASSIRRGKVEIKLTELFSANQVSELSVEDMTNIINKHLAFNDYEWQRDKMIAYRGKKLAENLETTLYRCPQCGVEFEMISNGNELKCQKCGFSVKVNNTGYFADNEYFEHPQQWYEWQRESVDDYIKNKDFEFVDQATLKGIKDGSIQEIGKGTIKLNYQGFVYDGTLDNIEQHFEVSIDNLFSLPYKAGYNFEIAIDSRVIQFWLKNGVQAVKWSLLVEQIYKSKQ